MEPTSSPNDAQSKESKPESPTIILHVLSPSVIEVPNKITFPAIPTSTTIGELKSKICDALTSRPRPERQRLIYRGSLLIQENLTLKDVFTQDTINNSEALSLHLVLPPTAHAPSTSRTPANVIYSQNSDAQHSLSSEPASTGPVHGVQQGPLHDAGTLHPAQGPTAQNGQGNLPQQQFTHPMHPQMGPFPHQQGQFPPHLQAALNNHFQTVFNQQFGGQGAMLGPNHHFSHPLQLNRDLDQAQAALSQQSVPGSLNHASGVAQNPFQVRQMQQGLFPQLVAQQQQARATAVLQGIGNVVGNQLFHGNPTHPMHNHQASAISTNSENPAPAPGNTTMIVTENRGPNNEQWRVIVESTSMTSPNNGNQSDNGQSLNSNPPAQSVSTIPTVPSERPQPAQITGTSETLVEHQQTTNGSAGQIVMADAPARFQQHLSSLESTLASGTAPVESVFDHTRSYLDVMANQPNLLSPDLEASLRTRLNNLSTQAEQLRASLTNMLMRVVAEQPSSPTPVPQPSQLSTVYVLSSPSGPQALLISPSGMYGTSSQSSTINALSFQTIIPHPPTSTPYAQPSASENNHANAPHPNNPPLFPPNQRAQPLEQVQQQLDRNEQHQRQLQQFQQQIQENDQRLHNHHQQFEQQVQQHEQQPQNHQQENNNQARDLVRILLPLGGHLWLFIRLFGFVYFFTAGGGYRRAVILGICAFLVFIAQTGVFRPLLQTVWEPIRRHAEGLLPLAAANDNALPNNVAPVPDNEPLAAAPAGANQAPPAHARNNREPTPQAAAERLLQERNLRNRNNNGGNVLRENLRRTERAVALFVASLVPGVGERHIAARDAAEAVRMAEVRQREEDERRRQTEGDTGDAAAGVSAEASEGVGNGEGARQEQEREQAGQQPLIEI